jgi:hypothetical protein
MTGRLQALRGQSAPVVSIAFRQMKTTTDTGAALIAASLALATVLGQGLATVLAHGLAMAIVLAERLTCRQLIQAGQGAAPASPAPTAEPVAALPAAPALERLPVRELRALARSAGHRALARSGRRSELLAVLA